jgi:hypothetical protein
MPSGCPYRYGSRFSSPILEVLTAIVVIEGAGIIRLEVKGGDVWHDGEHWWQKRGGHERRSIRSARPATPAMPYATSSRMTNAGPRDASGWGQTPNGDPPPNGRRALFGMPVTRDIPPWLDMRGCCLAGMQIRHEQYAQPSSSGSEMTRASFR